MYWYSLLSCALVSIIVSYTDHHVEFGCVRMYLLRNDTCHTQPSKIPTKRWCELHLDLMNSVPKHANDPSLAAFNALVALPTIPTSPWWQESGFVDARGWLGCIPTTALLDFLGEDWCSSFLESRGW